MWYYHVTGIKDGEFYYVTSFENTAEPHVPRDQGIVGAIIAENVAYDPTKYEKLYVVAMKKGDGYLTTESYVLEQTLPAYKWTPAKIEI